MQFVESFIREEEGQDVVEYGLLVATIGVVVLVGTGLFGDNIKTWFSRLASKVTTTA